MITKKKLVMKNRILFSLVGLLCIGGLVTGVMAYSGTAGGVVENANNVYFNTPVEPIGMIGGSLTAEPTYLTYSDDYQNVNSLYEYGDIEIAGTQYNTGAIQLDGDLTSSGDARIDSLVQTGAIATFTTTSTATAANVCDNPLWTVTPVAGTPTITLPATTTLFADCLTTNGDSLLFNVKTITTSTILAVGGGGNLDLDATATITADKSAKVTIIRDSATTYLMQIDNYNS